MSDISPPMPSEQPSISEMPTVPPVQGGRRRKLRKTRKSRKSRKGHRKGKSRRH